MPPKRVSAGKQSDCAGKRKRGARQSDAPDHARLPTGQSVVLRDSTIGVITDYEPDDGMYEITVESSQRIMYATCESILPRYQVILIDLQGRAELNGRRGTIEGWDSERQRYEIALDDAYRVKLQPQNVMLPHDARVHIEGLVSAVHYNGKLAKVVDHDVDSGKYDVQLFDNAKIHLRLKRDNVRL